MFTATGKIIYDPRDPRAGRKGVMQWWAMVKMDRGLSDYYGHWVSKELNENLNFPIWGVHMSATRGEKPPNVRPWGRYNGVTVSIHYSNDVKVTDKYVFLPAWSPDISAIRRELGLPYNPPVPFHITISNRKNQGQRPAIKLPFKVFPWEQPHVAIIDQLWRHPKK